MKEGRKDRHWGSKELEIGKRGHGAKENMG
jgi:hypothetical protein